MTTPSITPGPLYHDAATAIEWLCKTLGFERRLVVPGNDGTILHAHLTFGNGSVMLSSAEIYPFPQLCKSPREIGGVGTRRSSSRRARSMRTTSARSQRVRRS